MRRAAPPSREPGQLGPQDMPLVAPPSPTGPWVVTAERRRGEGPPDMTQVPFLPTLPLWVRLPIRSNKWMEDLLRMLEAWGTGKDAQGPRTSHPRVARRLVRDPGTQADGEAGAAAALRERRGWRRASRRRWHLSQALKEGQGRHLP